MLVLARKRNEAIHIGNDIVVKVIQCGRGTVRLGIEAPANVRVLRAELAETMSEHQLMPTPTASLTMAEVQSVA